MAPCGVCGGNPAAPGDGGYLNVSGAPCGLYFCPSKPTGLDLDCPWELERGVVGGCCDGGCCGGGCWVDNWGSVGIPDGAVFTPTAPGRLALPGCKAPGRGPLPPFPGPYWFGWELDGCTLIEGTLVSTLGV